MDFPPNPADLPSPPFKDIAGIANFRDIGGYAISSGHPSSGSSSSSGGGGGGAGKRSVTQGLVFRSADPSRVEAAGLEELKRLGLTTVFDLRSEPEIQRQGPEWKGVAIDGKGKGGGVFWTKGEGRSQEGRIERVWCPVFSTEDYSPEKIAVRYKEYASAGTEGFVQAYKAILGSAADAYRTVLVHIADEDPKPCLVHCTAGKDRTGVLVALIYLLCGVDDETIANEYALTDQGLKHMKPLFKERLLKNPALQGNTQGVDNMSSSKAENMLATIAMINATYGSAEKYVSEVVGLSDAQIKRVVTSMTSNRTPKL